MCFSAYLASRRELILTTIKFSGNKALGLLSTIKFSGEIQVKFGMKFQFRKYLTKYATALYFYIFLHFFFTIFIVAVYQPQL